ncbi:MAG TPA: 50S ribosomal protein L5 [Candidatus Babeliales bacterium]|nr:50S ribosomal protein L5 [Candidatus Babeliales bacterium]
MATARLKESYNKNIRPQLQKDLGLSNIMEVPKVNKIVINVGAKEAVSDSKVLKVIGDLIQEISGQKPVRTLARTSIAGFKIREGMPLGVMVTLRGDVMYSFLDRLINLALPKVKDFQGVTPKLDGRGNYNLGIKDATSIFPEVESGVDTKAVGLNVTIQTTATSDEHGYALLKAFGMPFRQTNAK